MSKGEILDHSVQWYCARNHYTMVRDHKVDTEACFQEADVKLFVPVWVRFC